MMLTFSVPETFDLTWFGEKLREDHGYLGPEQTFYPSTEIEDGDLVIEARRSDGTPIDEDDRADLQGIIDAHEGSPPGDVAAEQQRREDARAILDAHRDKARQVVAGEAVSFTPQERDRILSALAELL